MIDDLIWKWNIFRIILIEYALHLCSWSCSIGCHQQLSIPALSLANLFLSFHPYLLTPSPSPLDLPHLHARFRVIVKLKLFYFHSISSLVFYFHLFFSCVICFSPSQYNVLLIIFFFSNSVVFIVIWNTIVWLKILSLNQNRNIINRFLLVPVTL